ncbi:UBC-like protein [Suhomyces tanzawaensis NRRL Y-17324]|uniref:UBC-like protein n=1 Tax=Suhomyces tanzawaensis NRRL Y-17324 TaxID=984487 RepID=A0A1E4SSI9_9ASCO|nr:UBC-like protein [Suhomyces tanzawaensis NRRL Y-17324]ODV82480.1 UBC-like protein [Suhomyces tanzawaensis NRRL Y-17324]
MPRTPAGPHPFQRRLLKEYQGLVKANLPGITMVQHADTMSEYIFRIQVQHNPLYPENDRYYLSVRITREYPVDSPQVQFIKYEELDDEEASEAKIPIHPHIYSNGHICLNLLGDDWTPACSVESVLLSVQSLLGTNQVLERPPDNDSYVRHAPLNPKLTKFTYHDDDV